MSSTQSKAVWQEVFLLSVLVKEMKIAESAAALIILALWTNLVSLYTKSAAYCLITPDIPNCLHSEWRKNRRGRARKMQCPRVNMTLISSGNKTGLEKRFSFLFLDWIKFKLISIAAPHFPHTCECVLGKANLKIRQRLNSYCSVVSISDTAEGKSKWIRP